MQNNGLSEIICGEILKSDLSPQLTRIHIHICILYFYARMFEVFQSRYMIMICFHCKSNKQTIKISERSIIRRSSHIDAYNVLGY